MREMVGTLLGDRFRLVIRRDQREMSFHELVLDRSDGRLGPNITPLSDTSKEECLAAQVRVKMKVTPGGLLNMACGEMSRLVASAAVATRGVVIDKTGLSGDWFWYVRYASELGTLGGVTIQNNPDLPSYPTALREQLGVKLQSTRGPVDVIMIEAIQPLIPD
jgi:uncharacterized protein (TIGR03435 family)